MAHQSSPIGVAHGVTFGDGTPTRDQARVALFGEKNISLLRFFPEARVSSLMTPAGIPGLLVVDLPLFFKRPPPLDEAPSYLYGWLAGCLAADGSVT